MPGRSVDVLIVGAGPAGLSTARAVAAAGLETLVVERQRSVGEHVRTSGATAVSTVTRLGAPARTYHPLERLRVAAPAADAVFYGAGAFCILDVRGFYRWLASTAEDAGASVLLSTTAREVVREGAQVVGCVIDRKDSQGEIVRAKVVVDASGHRAQLSKRAGLHPGFTRFGVGAEYELLAPQADQREAVLIVGERYAPTGYGWSFPWGEGRVRVGVGLHHADVRNDPNLHLTHLLEDQEAFRLGLDGATVAERHAGLIPAERVAAQLSGDGFLAVGDAAGQASLVVGEGIRISLLAGEMAGEAIVEAVRRGRTDRRELVRYDRRFRREFGRELLIGSQLNRRLAAARDDGQWNRRVELLATMPADLVFDLLQSRIRPACIAGWYLRRPDRAFRSSALLRAMLGRG